MVELIDINKKPKDEPMISIFGEKIHVLEEKEPRFKTGDNVAYIGFPDICIGSISPDSFIGPFLGIYSIFTSQQWMIHFGHGGGPNTLHVNEDSLVKYIPVLA